MRSSSFWPCEPVGDHGRFWATGGSPLILRNSGIAINYAYLAHDWANGCWSIRLCHRFEFLYGVAARDLMPEIRLGCGFTDYAAGRDTLLEQAVELADK